MKVNKRRPLNDTEKSILIVLAAAWGVQRPLTLSHIACIIKCTPHTRSYYTVRHNLSQLVGRGLVRSMPDVVATLPTGGGDNRRIYELSLTTIRRLSRKAARLEFDGRTPETRHAPVPSLKDY